jgi:hypothetical protein
MMKSHRRQRPVVLVYIALILAALILFTYLLSRETGPVVNPQSSGGNTK